MEIVEMVSMWTDMGWECHARLGICLTVSFACVLCVSVLSLYICELWKGFKSSEDGTLCLIESNFVIPGNTLPFCLHIGEIQLPF